MKSFMSLLVSLLIIVATSVLYADDLVVSDDFVGLLNYSVVSNATGYVITMNDGTYTAGNVKLASGGTSGNYVGISLGKVADWSKNFRFEARVRMTSTNVSMYKVQMYQNSTNFVQVSCSNNTVGGSWRYRSLATYNNTNRSEYVTTSSGPAPAVKASSARWFTIKVEKSNGTVYFYVENSKKATISSIAVPVSGIFEPIVLIQTLTGSAKSMYIDFVQFTSYKIR